MENLRYQGIFSPSCLKVFAAQSLQLLTVLHQPQDFLNFFCWLSRMQLNQEFICSSRYEDDFWSIGEWSSSMLSVMLGKINGVLGWCYYCFMWRVMKAKWHSKFDMIIGKHFHSFTFLFSGKHILLSYKLGSLNWDAPRLDSYSWI